MTKMHLITGSAGTGKSTRIIEFLDQIIKGGLRYDLQKVLVLCRMHGARKRVLGLLGETHIPLKRVKIETIDAFAYQVINRYRRVAGIDTSVRPSGEAFGSEVDLFGTKIGFDPATEMAANLLSNKAIAEQVAAAYPVIIIDEFQDCTDSRLEMIMALQQKSFIVAAADDFQFLSSDGEESPSVAWAKTVGTTEALTELHRTRNERIINTASVLRHAVYEKIPMIDIEFDNSGKGGLAAWSIAFRIRYKKWIGNSVILINTLNTPFLDGTLRSLSGKLGKKERIGPYPFKVENPDAVDLRVQSAVEQIIDGVTSKEVPIGVLQQKSREHLPSLVTISCLQMLKIARLKGLESFPLSIIGEIVARVNLGETLYGTREHRRLAMTIHSAKNREFDYVFILWPHKLKGGHIQQRKLLYNAVTRAKKDAVLIVQGDLEKRLKTDSSLKLLMGVD